VGMATNIPPHNLNELTDGICAMIDNPEIDGLELMDYIKGPDFPTGGIICGEEGIRKAYMTGKGSVVIRSKTRIEESKKKNKKAIIVNEIPYQVNKSNLIIKIAELVQDKKITGISDLRDESDRKGLRIYIELKKDAIPDVILNQLFKHTQMQLSFGVNTVALVNRVPKTLTLKEILGHYIAHRKEVITKRTTYDLKIAKARLHILEGLKIALQNIDEMIALIKKSTNTQEARQNLKQKFNLSELQANAILDMKLQKLTGLEREKLENEFQEIVEKIKDFEDILKNESRVLQIIKEDQIEIKNKYGDARKTEISGAVGQMNMEDLIPKQQVAVLISKKGFIKRLPIQVFKSQLRGGRGVSGMSIRDEDIIDQIFVTSSHNFLLCFTNKGKSFKIKCYQIPEASRQSKGVSISHFLDFDADEKITTIIPVKDFNTEDYLLMTTQKGIVKKTAIKAFVHLKNSSIIAINLDKADSLRWVRRTSGDKHVILSTSAGMVIRFEETQIRAMGRSTRGVKGINIKPQDNLTSMAIIEPSDDKLQLLIVTKKGYGKNLKLNEFRCQKRGGIGVKCLKFRKTIKNDFVTDALITTKEDEIMLVTKEGVLCRQKIANISTQRRQSQGVKIQKLDEKDEVIAMARVISETEAALQAEEEAKLEESVVKPIEPTLPL
jgi:DNA gyrase subunit A